MLPRATRLLAATVMLALSATACAPAAISPGPSSSTPPATSAPATRSATPSATCAQAAPPTASDLPWWNERVFYEVFVRSFQDSDGDGIGDLRGLIDRLDYLNDGDPATTDDLGVTGIWLMPVAESPSYHGYDVVDYRAIERDYGTADDFRELIDQAHERGIAVIVDLVMNHSSREHPWFQESLDQGSQREDWYVWADERPRGVVKPDGGRVWHEAGGRFYYGYFWEGMPDLNLANDDVTAELDAIARYWVDEMGVDGFRLDAIKHFFEDGRELEDVPDTKVWLEAFQDRLETVDPDVLLVGESYDTTTSSASYVPEAVDITFDFGFATSILVGLRNGKASIVRSALEESLAAYPPGQRGVFLTNHDQPRVTNELAGDVDAARAAATIALTSPGVPFVYYGEEIGMSGTKPDERIRTPMAWDATATGGFTTGTPWQEPADGGTQANVETQAADDRSLLSHYRSLIHLRAAHPSLAGADATVLDASSDAVLAVLRRADDETTLVLSNVSDEPVEDLTVDLSPAGCDAFTGTADVLLGDAAWPVDELDPYESVIVRLSP